MESPNEEGPPLRDQGRPFEVPPHGVEQIVVTRHGKPAGILVGFASEDDWFDYRLENDPGFQARIAEARRQLSEGKGVRMEDVDWR